MSKGLKDPFDKVFDKMDGVFEKLDKTLDGIDFESNIDDIHIKIQNLKDKFNLSTKDAINVMAKHVINTRRPGEKVSVRMEVKSNRARNYILKKLAMLAIMFGLVLFGIWFILEVSKDKETTPPPLVEKSAPLNPTLNTSEDKPQTDAPTFRTIE